MSKKLYKFNLSVVILRYLSIILPLKKVRWYLLFKIIKKRDRYFSFNVSHRYNNFKYGWLAIDVILVVK